MAGPPGQDPAVIWSVEDTTLATVSADGTVQASPCYRDGRTRVVATLLEKSSVRGTATVDVVAPAVALVSLQFIRDAGTGNPVSLAAASGEVEVGAVAAPGVCTVPSHIALRVQRPGLDTAVAGAGAGTITASPYLLRWATDAKSAGAPVFPNGDYIVWL